MSGDGDPGLPLVLRLALPQPLLGSDAQTSYDDAADELRVATAHGWQFAADLSNGGPQTKKRDIERGEDVKGSW